MIDLVMLKLSLNRMLNRECDKDETWFISLLFGTLEVLVGIKGDYSLVKDIVNFFAAVGIRTTCISWQDRRYKPRVYKMIKTSADVMDVLRRKDRDNSWNAEEALLYSVPKFNHVAHTKTMQGEVLHRDELPREAYKELKDSQGDYFISWQDGNITKYISNKALLAAEDDNGVPCLVRTTYGTNPARIYIPDGNDGYSVIVQELR